MFDTYSFYSNLKKKERREMGAPLAERRWTGHSTEMPNLIMSWVLAGSRRNSANQKESVDEGSQILNLCVTNCWCVHPHHLPLSSRMCVGDLSAAELECVCVYVCVSEMLDSATCGSNQTENQQTYATDIQIWGQKERERKQRKQKKSFIRTT